MYEKLTFTPDTFERELLETADPAVYRQQDTLVCIRPRKPVYSILHLFSQDVFGRSLLDPCDLSVSQAHFRYENGTITDLGSTNGTYVNGRRITTAALQPFDTIQCGFHTLQYLGTCFLCDSLHTGRTARPTTLSTPPPSAPPAQAAPPEPARYSLETWSLRQPPVRQNLFLSCGSSLLMCAGTLISAGLMYIMKPGQTASLETSLVMTLSMSAGFFLYGLLSRNLSYKNELRALKESESQYLCYLESVKEDMVTLQHTLAKRHETILSCWDALDPGLWQTDCPLCIGHQKTVVTAMEPGTFTWQHRMHPLYEKVQEILDLANQPIRTARYLQTEEEISGCPQQIFSRILWTQTPDHAKIFASLPYEFPHQYENRKRLVSSVSDFQIGTQSVRIRPTRHTTVNWEKLASCPCPLQEAAALPAFAPGPCLQISLADGVWLDLQQSGPHGLIAGTTGSGKSEVLSTLLTRLVTNNHPDYLRYILVDFKGGAFARPFQEFPHHAGTITDLDSHELDRLIRCLKGELVRREHAIQTCLTRDPSMTADLDTCQPFLKTPIPHLLVVVDEFAQLRQQYPAQLDFLQEIARTGRSLGLHLILSTQKPGGIVSGQIMANTGFIIACKVRDSIESLELLGTKDAADLRIPGQAILATDQGRTPFQCDYMRQPLHKKAVLCQDGRTVQSAGKEETILDYCLKKARELYPLKPPLFTPTSAPEKAAVRIYDDTSHTLQDLTFAPGQRIRIQCPGQADKLAAILRSQQPNAFYVEEYPPGSRWFLLHMDVPCTLVFKDELPEALPAVAVIVLETTPHVWDTPFDHTFVTGTRNDLAMFGSYEDMPAPAGCTLPDRHAICFGQAGNPQSPQPIPDLDAPNDWNRIFCLPVLGKENNAPVFWDHTPIYISGMQADFMKQVLQAFSVPVSEDPACENQLFTSGWRQQAALHDLPWLSTSWILKTPAGCTGLEPLLYD